MIFLAVLFVVLGVVAAACLRIASWHEHEATFWQAVSTVVAIDPALDDLYAPQLEWAQANPPSLLARLRTWQTPATRMKSREDAR